MGMEKRCFITCSLTFDMSDETIYLWEACVNPTILNRCEHNFFSILYMGGTPTLLFRYIVKERI